MSPRFARALGGRPRELFRRWKTIPQWTPPNGKYQTGTVLVDLKVSAHNCPYWPCDDHKARVEARRRKARR